LYFETTIVDTTLGNDVLKMYADGILNEHSIGFEIIESERNNDKNTTNLKELKLWEGSTVTWGANENTPMTGIKGTITSDCMAEQIKRIDKALSDGTYTDETFELLRIELAYISELTKSLEGPEIPPVIEPTDSELLEAFNKGLNGK